MSKQYTIRTMTKGDLEVALDWAALEGWNPGLHDAQCFYDTDPHGFFMGWLNNEPISSVSVVAYNNTYGFVGFYIVKPNYRGQGYGLKIWQHAMKYAGSRNLGLDGIADQQPNYIKSGFKLAYHDITYKGPSRKYPPNPHLCKLSVKQNSVSLRSAKSAEKQSEGDCHVALQSKTPRNDSSYFDQIFQYDRDCFPAERHQFLKYWINGPERTALGYIDGNQLKGYGVIRKCRSWYKIGPLFANNGQIAEKILQGLMNSLPEGSEVGMDIPEVNQSALQLAAKYNLSEAFRLGRMYTQTPPKINLQKIYSVTSYELG